MAVLSMIRIPHSGARVRPQISGLLKASVETCQVAPARVMFGGSKMTTVDVSYAGENLSGLVERAVAGEDVVISSGGVPVARLARLGDGAPQRRRLGILEGQITTTPDFDAPLPDDILAAFEGR